MVGCSGGGAGKAASYGPAWARFRVRFPSAPKMVSYTPPPGKYSFSEQVGYVANSPTDDLDPRPGSPLPRPDAFFVTVAKEDTASDALRIVAFSQYLPGWRPLDIGGSPATEVFETEAAVNAPGGSGLSKVTDADATEAELFVAHGTDWYWLLAVTARPSVATAFVASFAPQ